MKASVCTLARGRADRLANLVAALDRQTQPPHELVVAAMQPEPYELPDMRFPVRQVRVPGKRLPLARARNAAADAIEGDTLVFLDVDCLPLPDHLETIAADGSAATGACVMGEVRYLDGHADTATPPESLWNEAEAHPARRFGSESVELADHGQFWSLSFALTPETFARAGGFDERFEGYGGEDTDFAAALRDANVPLRWVPGARAVHQWHAVSVPPLQHLADIVENANRFHAKHGRTCMEYWVDQLLERGFVARGADGRLAVAREPSADELEAARRGPDIRFS